MDDKRKETLRWMREKKKERTQQYLTTRGQKVASEFKPFNRNLTTISKIILSLWGLAWFYNCIGYIHPLPPLCKISKIAMKFSYHQLMTIIHHRNISYLY